MDCAAPPLVLASKCLCLPKKVLKQVNVYLLCQWLKKKAPPVVTFSYEPASAIADWTDGAGNHSGNLATFNATADPSTLLAIVIVGKGITSITGLSIFPVINTLQLDNNSITSIDFTGCSASLQTFSISNNPITTLDTSPLSGLIQLTVSNCTSLVGVDVTSNSQIQLIQCSGCTSMLTLNASGCLALSGSLVAYNCTSMTSINLTGCSSLVVVDCHGNSSMTTLTLTGCASLIAVDASFCDLTGTFDVHGITTLTTLDLTSNTNLSGLDIHDCTGFGDVSLMGCPLTSFVATGCTQFQTLHFNGALIATISIPDCTILPPAGSGGLTAENMPNLTSINAPLCVFTDVFRFDNCDNAGFTSISDTLITALGDGPVVVNCANITTVSLPNLVTTNQEVNIVNNPLLSSVTLTSLVACGGTFEMFNNPSLAGLSLPALNSVDATFDISGCPALVNFSAPLWSPTTDISFNGDSLNSASIDSILSVCAANAGAMSGKTINLAGGSNLSHASWSVAALADETTLTTAGATVVSNP